MSPERRDTDPNGHKLLPPDRALTIPEIRELHAGAALWFEEGGTPTPFDVGTSGFSKPSEAVEMVGTLLTELATVDTTTNKYAAIVEILSEALAIQARCAANREIHGLIAQARNAIVNITNWHAPQTRNCPPNCPRCRIYNNRYDAYTTALKQLRDAETALTEYENEAPHPTEDPTI